MRLYTEQLRDNKLWKKSTVLEYKYVNYCKMIIFVFPVK